MAYRTDGSSHETGIANEDSLKTQLENGLARALYPNLGADFQVVKKGGTTHKEDMVIECAGHPIHNISAKHKKKLGSGSFDWVNTSAATQEEKNLSVFRNDLAHIKATRTGRDVEETRELVKTRAHEALRTLDSDAIKRILQKHVCDKNQDMHIIITETSTGDIHSFCFKDHPLNTLVQRGYEARLEFLNPDPSQTSAKVVFWDPANPETTFDWGIRMRLLTNNGITALLGKNNKGKNNTSSAVIKIQQDNIIPLLSTMGTNVKTIKGNQ